LQQKLSNGNDRNISRPQVLFGPIVNRAHTFGGAGVVDQKLLTHAGESLMSLFLAILQIIVVNVANFNVVGADTAFELLLFLAHGASAAEKDIKPHGMLVIDGNMGMDRVALSVAL
jgi:hypothetical protein